MSNRKIVSFPGRNKGKNEKNTQFPSVLKLRFELVSPYYYGKGSLHMDPEKKKEFLRLAKAKDGIIREVLVHGEMNLHAMHYMILKLFGWWNSHLHRYFLTDSDFEVATDGQKLDYYLGMCGILFRFPGADFSDQFWDEDYKGEYSINTWLKKKYTNVFHDFSVEDSYKRSQMNVEDFKKKYKEKGTYQPEMTLEELDKKLRFDEPYNSVLESVRVRDLFKKGMGEEYDFAAGLWRDYMNLLVKMDPEEIADSNAELLEGSITVKDMMQELLDLRKNALEIEKAIRYGQAAEVEKFFKMSAKKALDEQKKIIKETEQMLESVMAFKNPGMLPFIDELYYSYDFGDDWCVRITCEEAYTADSNYDRSFERLYADDEEKLNNRVPVDKLQYKDTHGDIVDDTLREKLQKVYIEGIPVCVMMDGLSVMEDVGGIYGFRDFLMTINDKSPDMTEEVKEQKHWARMQGWTGRKFTPEKFL